MGREDWYRNTRWDEEISPHWKQKPRNMIRRLSVALLLWLLPAIVIVAQAQFLDIDIDENNTYYLYGDDGWGDVPKGWEKQQALLKNAKVSDLESMAISSGIPAIRAMSFHRLASKRNKKCYDIFLEELSDTCMFWLASFDVWDKKCVASFDLSVAETNPTLFDKSQWHFVDSVIVFRPDMNHLNKLASATRLRGMDGLYERLHELYLQGDSYLLPLIAEYKNEDDIPLLVSALREYAKTIDKDGSKGNTNDALDALMVWNDEAFTPVLEELRDYELSHKYTDYHRYLTLFKVVMSYDNEWAYDFIKDTFEKGGKDKYSFPEHLYRAYYEEEERTRFLPLVEKYGERPVIW